jgi:hypothetical protein
VQHRVRVVLHVHRPGDEHVHRWVRHAVEDELHHEVRAADAATDTAADTTDAGADASCSCT